MRTRLVPLILAMGLVACSSEDDSASNNANNVNNINNVNNVNNVNNSNNVNNVNNVNNANNSNNVNNVADMSMDGGSDMADMAQDMPPDLPPGLPDGPSSERQTARPLGSTDATQGFHEYLPVGYGNTTQFPLLVFFHGVGENGNGDTELGKVLSNGPPRYIDRDQWPSDRPFIVLSPQHPGDGCHSPAEIRTFIEFAVSNYDVDESRIYLTGLSCGGIGLWNYLGQDTDTRAAAAVPIAGNGNSAWNNAGCELGKVAIWGFHGDADPTVPVNGTINPMNNIIACPMPPRKEAKLTIYPGVGHNSWSRTYDLSAGHDIYTWLLTHSK